MQQDTRILKQKCNAAMIALCPSLVKLGPRTPEKAVGSDPPPKLARENALNRQ